MSWSSLKRRIGVLVVGVLIAHLPAIGRAQNAEQIKFETFDQVELNGTWYPSSKGKKAAPILLLHAIGSSSKHEGLVSLAKKLQAEGHAVLAFDFRGHGESVVVGRGFWDVRANQQYVKGYNVANPKTSIDRKDFNPVYWPMLVNDIAAARMVIDRKNDAGDCNSVNLMIVGVEDGATLGAFWLASEWNRYIVTTIDPFTNLPVKWESVPEGKRVVGCVWLSMASSIQRQPVVQLLTWLRTTGQEKRVPMAFLYGSKDGAAANFAEKCYSVITNTGKLKLENTAHRAIRGTSASGANLLKEDLDTEKLIVAYINNIQQARSTADWKEVGAFSKGYVWVLPNKQPVVAKNPQEQTLRPVPVQSYGFPVSLQ
ncbi:MAG: hypothetical protein NZ700_17790 [Gemmataceae bacterium]|nr:hypothetical protein [Gemmataceae bacterium]MDW8264415.1 hypothetical protein [Gemmataceae bacterium]